MTGSFAAAVAEAFLRRRDKLLANPAFHRATAAFPLSRWLVRRRTRQLFDIAAGFVYSQVLTSCVRLDLFDRLAHGPRSLAQLAQDTGIPESGLEHLLRAASELGLLQRRAGGWGLGELGAASRGNPGIAAMVAHNTVLYGDLTDPLTLLGDRSRAELGGYWAYAAAPGASEQENARTYSELMASSQSFVADDVLAAFSFHRASSLLDIGGGSGVFAAAALRAHPQLSATVFDLPPVAALADERFAQERLLGRGAVQPGDMFADELPQGMDVISLVRILHDHDDEPVKELLRSVRRALSPEGRLVIAEPLAGTSGAGGVGAYFELYLWAMGSGRPRTRKELTAMLEAAGFADVREHKTRRPLLVRVLSARRAARTPDGAH